MIDLLVDSNNDLQIVNGDLLIGKSDGQHQKFLLMLEPGSVKEFPSVGVGITNFLESEDDGEMIAEIRKQFTGDGLAINKVLVENGKIAIDANYTNG